MEETEEGEERVDGGGWRLRKLRGSSVRLFRSRYPRTPVLGRRRVRGVWHREFSRVTSSRLSGSKHRVLPRRRRDRSALEHVHVGACTD